MDADENGLPDGWTLETSGPVVARILGVGAQHGTRALRIGDASPLAGFTLRSANVPVVPGLEARATLWIRDDTRPNPPITATLPPQLPDTGLAGQPTFELRFTDANGGTLLTLRPDWVNVTRGWNQGSIVAPAPYGATHARIIVTGANEHSRAWTLDNATLETGGVESAAMVANGNLDAGKPPSMPDGWRRLCGGGGKATHVEESFQRGHVRLSAPAAGSCELYSHKFPVLLTDCFTVHGRVDGSGGVQWGIRFYDAADNVLTEETWYGAAPQLALNGHLCSPGGAAYGRFIVQTGAGIESDFLVDDIYVTRAG